MSSPLEAAAVAAPVEAPEALSKPLLAPAAPKRKAPKPCAELRALADRYMASLVSSGYSAVTIKNAGSDFDWLLRYLAERGVERVADVTTEVLNDFALWLREQRSQYHEDRTLSLGHVLHRLTTTRQFFRWLKKEMVILYDPSEDMELPKRRASLPHCILTQDEAKRLMAAPDLRSPVGYRDKALLELLYATGIRTAELIRLKVGDIDYAARTVFVREGKGGKDRVIPVPHLALGYVREYAQKVRPRFARNMKKGDDGTLFLNWTGAKIEINGLCLALNRSAALAGIDKRVTALTFRHSIASHLLENGMNVRFIQEFLGHARLATTQVYTKVTLSGLRKYFNKCHPREKRLRGKLGGAA